jgi:LCP family protein required for cell wall assembly
MFDIISGVFMKREQPTSSIDGFVPRRSGARLGDLHTKEKPQPISRTIRTTATAAAAETVGTPRRGKVIGRSDIDDSLREIDDVPEQTKKSRRQRRKDAKLTKPKSKVKRIIKWVVIVLLVLGLAAGAYLAYNFLKNSNKVFQGNIFDIAQTEPLKQDANGRSNFVIFGTAEDDEAGKHGGANLTDSIMVLSINQEKNDAYMLSIPRDLYVEYESVCSVGYRGKINEVYGCASDNGANEAAGAAALQKKVGEIVGLDMQYYIHLNFTAVVQAVDAVGGVSVDIESNDPLGRGIFDDNFDWKCNYKCNYVKYPVGPTPIMDGEHALALARARGASGNTYGLANANFDREKNQQKILKALREKALSAGTLANPITITNLMNALGNNLRTNVQTKEVQTLAGLAKDISTDSIIQLTLVGADNMIVKNGTQDGQSIVLPVAGLYDYSEIIEYVNKNVNATAVSRENAHVSVLNGGRAAGVAQTEADKLEVLGFAIDEVSNAPDGTFGKVEIYQVDTTKTASAAKLEELYGVKVKTTAPPVSVTGETGFIIILGPES